LNFFGLKPEDKPKLHEQIFQLMYYGKGFTHSDVYNMPIYLRNFYYKQLADTRKKENEEVKKAQQKSKPINPRFKR
tara:strand:+ start:365 stop:592 length:228 start_codon:yes stop_codon:yes gene_type:complete